MLLFYLDFSIRQRHKRVQNFEHLTGAQTMNTDKFDKHAKNNLAFYEGFLNISKYVVALIIITLALMAYFLV